MTRPARDRILDTATALFYRHGINNVGVDLVISRSGVAKMTLYHHFESKDALVLAFLEKINADWSAWLRGRVAASRLRGRRRPLAVFDALEEWFGSEEFRGCPFISTAAEIREPGHPIHRAAWRFKRGLRDYLRDLLREAGARDAESLADQLLLLADGAIVRAALEGEATAARTARRAAAVLLR
jgi:AcrR family transcriptional regulator